MKIVTIEDKTQWDGFVAKRKEANFLQSWDFYEFHKMRGNQVVRRAVVDEKNRILGVYAGVLEQAKRGKHLAIAGGPILDWQKREIVDAIFTDIREQGKKLDCVFVRVRPQLERSEDALNLMHSLRLKMAPMYLSVEYAGVLDLTKTEEEILAGASQGFRRKLRKAVKNQVKIEKSQDPNIIKEFYRIQLETAKRQKFYAFSEDFLRKQFMAFAKNDEAIMYIAKLEDEILAMNFMIFYGNEASYHYGVSSGLGTRYSAAPLLHIEAMREARERKIGRYNLWGIVGKDETEHRFYGVSEFKRSFGVQELKYTPAHDFVLKPFKYEMTEIIENVRKRVRHV